MKQTQRKERDKIIKSEYREMVRRGPPIWEAKEQLAAKYEMCSQSIVTLDLLYEVKAQVRMLRFAKAGVMQKEGERVEVQVMTYTPETNNRWLCAWNKRHRKPYNHVINNRVIE